MLQRYYKKLDIAMQAVTKWYLYSTTVESFYSTGIGFACRPDQRLRNYEGNHFWRLRTAKQTKKYFLQQASSLLLLLSTAAAAATVAAAALLL